jgi:hypothetical protein
MCSRRESRCQCHDLAGLLTLIVTEPHQCSFEPKRELSFLVSLHSIGIKLFVQLHEIVKD